MGTLIYIACDKCRVGVNFAKRKPAGVDLYYGMPEVMETVRAFLQDHPPAAEGEPIEGHPVRVITEHDMEFGGFVEIEPPEQSR